MFSKEKVLGLVGISVVCIGAIVYMYGESFTTADVGVVQEQEDSDRVVTEGEVKTEVDLLITPNEDKSIDELKVQASSFIEFEGVITGATTLGSKGNLEMLVGELNSEDVKPMFFNMNIDFITFDNMTGSLVANSKIPLGGDGLLYCIDNTLNSSFTPISLILNPTDNIEHMILDSIDMTDTVLGVVNVLTDKLSSNKYYVDDNTQVSNILNGEPMSLEDIPEGSRLFVLTGDYLEVAVEDVSSWTEEDELHYTDGLDLLTGLREEAIYVKRLSVYTGSTVLEEE